MHICGQCLKQFKSEAEYLAHKCEKTGVAPTDPKSMGENYEAIQNAALARGEAKIK